MKEHKQFMLKAISLSKENLKTMDGGPFGCVIVRDGKVLSAESNTVTRDCDPTAHAEINAIRAAAKNIGKADLSGCIMYTSAEPCPMCLSAIYWSNIAEVYYRNTKRDAEWAGFGDEFITVQLQKKIEAQKITFSRIFASEAITVFEEWVSSSAEMKDKIKDGSL